MALARFGFLLIVVFFCRVGVAFAGWEEMQAAWQRSEAQRMIERQKKQEALAAREAHLAQCEESYDICFENAKKNSNSCGISDECQKRYKAEKKACVTASELCEQQISPQ